MGVCLRRKHSLQPSFPLFPGMPHLNLPFTVNLSQDDNDDERKGVTRIVDRRCVRACSRAAHAPKRKQLSVKSLSKERGAAAPSQWVVISRRRRKGPLKRTDECKGSLGQIARFLSCCEQSAQYFLPGEEESYMDGQGRSWPTWSSWLATTTTAKSVHLISMLMERHELNVGTHTLTPKVTAKEAFPFCRDSQERHLVEPACHHLFQILLSLAGFLGGGKEGRKKPAHQRSCSRRACVRANACSLGSHAGKHASRLVGPYIGGRDQGHAGEVQEKPGHQVEK